MAIIKKSLPQRIIIYTKDVELITSRKYNAARRLLQQIKEHHSKADNELVTVTEFCQYTGLTEEQVTPFLQG